MTRSRARWKAAASILSVMAVVSTHLVHAQAEDALCKSIQCLESGETNCDRSTATCPPCIYQVNGGYSCYGKIADKCPFPDVIADCSPKPTVTPAPEPTPSTSSAVLTPAPAIAPTTAPSPPSGASSSSGTSSNSNSNANAAPSSSSSGSPSSSSSASDPPTGGKTNKALPQSAESTEAKNSNTNKPAAANNQTYVTIAIIAGVAFAVVMIILLVIRRIKRRNEEEGILDTPKVFQSGRDKQFTLQVDPTEAHQATPDSPTPSDRMSDGSDIQSLLSMSSGMSSTVEFTQYAANGRRTSSRQPMGPKLGLGLTNRSTSRSTAVYRGDDAVSGRGPTSLMVKKPIMEGEEESTDVLKSLRRPTAERLVNKTSASFLSDRSSAAASFCTNDDEYDIVDPGTLHDAERRNTETLVRDGRFRFLSSVSITDSDISTEESQPPLKEHEI